MSALAARQELPPAVAHKLGFELGWDHAHHGLRPPEPLLFGASALRPGWQAGCATFGRHTLDATPHVRRWLALRVLAWQQGLPFDSAQISANYLRQIDVTHCPITREPLSDEAGCAQQRSYARLLDSPGFQAGLLCVMSRRALAGRDLNPDEARRLALLHDFVRPLPGDGSALQALCLLPPNRLYLANPQQALQALLTRQLSRPEGEAGLQLVEALFGAKRARSDYRRFCALLVAQRPRTATPEQLLWALEDAWADPALLAAWQAVARPLSRVQAEQLVQDAAALMDCGLRVRCFS